jgi:hypothetical protein
MTSCGTFKTWRDKDNAYCSASAFVDSEKLKPKAPQTADIKEFKKVAGQNIVDGRIMKQAYDSLRECWEYWVGPPDKTTQSKKPRN